MLTYNPNGELLIRLLNLTIRGKSIGGCCTCIVIDDLNIAFDMGYNPCKTEKLTDVFISHGLADHIGCLHFCHATKKLNHNFSPWRMTIPGCYIEPFKIMATAVSSLGRGGGPINMMTVKTDDGVVNTIKPYDKFICDIIPSELCTHIDLIGNSTYCASAFHMNHKIKSYGYVIYEKRTKLKDQYRNMSGNELGRLRLSGTIIHDNINFPTIAFTGDTTFDAVLICPDMLNSKILIMECTHFLDSTIENAIENGHTHYRQILDNIKLFNNEYIILCHFSQKYRTFDDIVEYVEMLDDIDKKKIIFWI